MDVILIPGMWLDASAWDEVVPTLARGGHRTHALTLPGMESKHADRSQVIRRDHVDAVVAAIDSLDPEVGKVVLVGHSAGGGLAHAAADARPGWVARIVYVASEPPIDGAAGEGWPIERGEIPLPDWSFFDAEMVADLDDEQRAELRERAIPTPARAVTDPLRLSDGRAYEIPATVMACEYSAATLRRWLDEKVQGTEGLAKLTSVDYVDLDCGHWPQFTKPYELADLILATVDATADGAVTA